MNAHLWLGILAKIMNWDVDRARIEYDWLRLMARLKYDGYRDFQAGMGFLESLATWLQQFEAADREVAYAFIRKKLIYIGPSEMMKLVEQFYPRIIYERLLSIVANEHDIPSFSVHEDNAARTQLKNLCRQTLIMGLSDGARIDGIRRSNAGRLTNEQFVLMTQPDNNKWQDLLNNLRKEQGNNTIGFRLIYLVDDFAGTGTSFFRYKEEEEKWAGKLWRFRESIENAIESLGRDLLTSDWELCVHHYVATTQAVQYIDNCLKQAKKDLETEGWAQNIYPTYGTILPSEIRLKKGRDDDFIRLTEKYYDSEIETEHTNVGDVGGNPHMGLGYGKCALPLVLEHNTPNNSVALLWADTSKKGMHGTRVSTMRPLFRRRQRHERLDR